MFTELESWIGCEVTRAEEDLSLLCSTVEGTLGFEAGGHSWIWSKSNLEVAPQSGQNMPAPSPISWEVSALNFYLGLCSHFQACWLEVSCINSRSVPHAGTKQFSTSQKSQKTVPVLDFHTHFPSPLSLATSQHWICRHGLNYLLHK